MQAGPSSFPAFPDFTGIARSDLDARAAYAEGAGIFRIVPEGVVVPSTTGALARLVRWASANGVSLTPRGAGSGMAGGNLGRGVVADLTVLDGAPLEIDGPGRLAHAGAAVTLRALGEAAGRAGLRLPPDPSSARFATLGGMLSTNASGPRSVRAGSVRRWVRSIDLVTADGAFLTLERGAAPPDTETIRRFRRDAEPALLAARETIRRRFPRTLKCSSGYALDRWLESGDLLDLIVGSEGTLGCITGATWRLEPIPLGYGGVRASVRGLDALGDIVAALRPLEPSALEYLDATFLEFAGVEGGGAAGMVMVEFEDGDGASIESRVAAARLILAPHSDDIRPALDRRTLEALWAVRHAASPMLAQLGESRRSLQVIEDGCVPVEALSRYIQAVRQAARRHGIQAVLFGHAGDGNLHVNLLPDVGESGWNEKVAGIFEEVSEAVISLGGVPSGEHGDGRLRSHLLERVFGPDILALFRMVKAAFDPAGIFNPGVKLPAAPDDRWSTLKVGEHAAPLPARIEAGLREIERSAGYSLSRLDLAGH